METHTGRRLWPEAGGASGGGPRESTLASAQAYKEQRTIVCLPANAGHCPRTPGTGAEDRRPEGGHHSGLQLWEPELSVAGRRSGCLPLGAALPTARPWGHPRHTGCPCRPQVPLPKGHRGMGPRWLATGAGQTALLQPISFSFHEFKCESPASFAARVVGDHRTDRHECPRRALRPPRLGREGEEEPGARVGPDHGANGKCRLSDCPQRPPRGRPAPRPQTAGQMSCCM